MNPWTPSGPHEIEIDRSRLREMRSRLPEAVRRLDEQDAETAATVRMR
ncbi:hypothetical protein ACIBQ6_06515 [Nonomuraea sp. NPDC049655]